MHRCTGRARSARCRSCKRPGRCIGPRRRRGCPGRRHRRNRRHSCPAHPNTGIPWKGRCRSCRRRDPRRGRCCPTHHRSLSRCRRIRKASSGDRWTWCCRLGSNRRRWRWPRPRMETSSFRHRPWRWGRSSRPKGRCIRTSRCRRRFRPCRRRRSNPRRTPLRGPFGFRSSRNRPLGCRHTHNRRWLLGHCRPRTRRWHRRSHPRRRRFHHRHHPRRTILRKRPTHQVGFRSSRNRREECLSSRKKTTPPARCRPHIRRTPPRKGQIRRTPHRHPSRRCTTRRRRPRRQVGFRSSRNPPLGCPRIHIRRLAQVRCTPRKRRRLLRTDPRRRRPRRRRRRTHSCRRTSPGHPRRCRCNRNPPQGCHRSHTRKWSLVRCTPRKHRTSPRKGPRRRRSRRCPRRRDTLLRRCPRHPIGFRRNRSPPAECKCTRLLRWLPGWSCTRWVPGTLAPRVRRKRRRRRRRSGNCRGSRSTAQGIGKIRRRIRLQGQSYRLRGRSILVPRMQSQGRCTCRRRCRKSPGWRPRHSLECSLCLLWKHSRFPVQSRCTILRKSKTNQRRTSIGYHRISRG